MSIIQGAIPVTGFMGPTDSADTYAVTDAIYGIDGYRSVSAITARNTISTERRREGMLVYTQDDKNIWQLLPGPWTDTNSDWKLFISSGASASLSGITAGFDGWTSSTASYSIIADNGTGNASSGNFSVVIGSGNTITGNNSAIIGGYGITGNSDNTVYIPNARLAETPGSIIYSAGTPLEQIFSTNVTSANLWSASTGVNSIVANNGTGNLASGDYAIAEGQGTQAIGLQSRSEGFYTLASGNTSHAEGDGSIAYAEASHAEGSGSYSYGYASHAEGSNTQAKGDNSHAEGKNTTASGMSSHAGGIYTIANGYASFVHGTGSTANGIGTIVLGNNITGNSDNTVYISNARLAETPGSIIYSAGTPLEQIFVLSGNALTQLGIKNHIPSGTTVDVVEDYQYFVYGNLTLEGTLNNTGQVVIMNGSFINSGGTYNAISGGSMSLVSSQSINKYIISTGLTANVPLVVYHNLGTTDIMLSVKDLNTNNKIILDEYNYNLNNVTIESTQTLSNIKITIIG